MNKKLFVMAAFALAVGAAVLLYGVHQDRNSSARGRFMRRAGSRFELAGRPFRFVGANVAVMFRDEDRARMPETLRQAAQAGIKVVRVWAFGEGGPNDVKPIADSRDWPRTFFFRKTPNQWNEQAFVHLDRVI